MLFEPRGTVNQVGLISQALERSWFPWDRFDPLRVIPVEWDDLSRWSAVQANGVHESNLHLGRVAYYDTNPHSHHHDVDGGADPLEHRGRVLGLAWYDGHITLDLSLEADPPVAGEVFWSEGAHMFDFFGMEDPDRAFIWNALHPDPAHQVPLDTPIVDGQVIDPDHPEHGWFDRADYYSFVGEAWMGLFVSSFTDYPVTIAFPAHPITGDAVAQVRLRWLGVEPEPPDEPDEPEPPPPAPPPGPGCPPFASAQRAWRRLVSRR